MQRTNLNRGMTDLVDELVRNGITLDQARKEFERQYITASIRYNDGNLTRSAQRLGVHRNTLRNKVCNLGITIEECNGRPALRRSARGSS